MGFDLLIKNARTRFSQEELLDIGIRNGRIARVAARLRDGKDTGQGGGGDTGEDAGGHSDGRPGQVLDAGGRLVTESFVNGHLHLCKVYTLTMVGQEALTSYQGEAMGKAMTAIELASKVKEQYQEEWIYRNATKAARLALKYGNTHIRAFADTDTKAKLEGVKALLRVREEFKNSLEIRVVAFPQDGVVRDPGAEDYVRQALELGADVVGGIPWIEYTDEEARQHIDLMFALAKGYDKDVSMLIDDAGDPGLRTLEMLAVKTIREGWEGRVTAQHARAMHLYPEPYFRKVLALLKRARIGVVSDPQTGPLHARVRDLYHEGLGLALGQDDIADAYYPFGRNNMLEVAFLAAHLLWMTTFPEMEILYDLITTRAAQAMGIKDFVLREGNPANLVVLNAQSVWEALTEHAPPLHVIKEGREVTLGE